MIMMSQGGVILCFIVFLDRYRKHMVWWNNLVSISDIEGDMLTLVI